MAYELRNTSVILDGRLKHICKFWHTYASPFCSDHNPYTGGGGGMVIYLPPEAQEGSPWARERTRAREDAWVGGGWRGDDSPEGGAGSAELQSTCQAPRSQSPRWSSQATEPKVLP